MLLPVGLTTEVQCRLSPERFLLTSLAFPTLRACIEPLSSRPGKRATGRQAFARRSAVGKKLYVGNLTYNVNETDLQELFSHYGTVESAQVIVDRETNRSKGFGFVEMGSDAEAQAAI
jgi:RNA recognition motif-containing protein